jgi:hypothetical protein
MKWKLFCILILILGISWGCESEWKLSERERQEIRAEIQRRKAEEKEKKEAEFHSMKPKEHLTRMKETKKSYEREEHFNAIPKGTPEHKEALNFLEKENHKKRIEWARSMRDTMLDLGVESFKVWTTDKDDTTLVYQYAYLTDVRIHRMEKNFKESDMIEMGFKKFILRCGLRKFDYVFWEEKDYYQRPCSGCGAIVDRRTCYIQYPSVGYVKFYCDTCKHKLLQKK